MLLPHFSKVLNPRTEVPGVTEPQSESESELAPAVSKCLVRLRCRWISIVSSNHWKAGIPTDKGEREEREKEGGEWGQDDNTFSQYTSSTHAALFHSRYIQTCSPFESPHPHPSSKSFLVDPLPTTAWVSASRPCGSSFNHPPKIPSTRNPQSCWPLRPPRPSPNSPCLLPPGARRVHLLLHRYPPLRRFGCRLPPLHAGRQKR